MANNTLDIILRFLVDKNSQKAAQSAVNSVGSGNLGGGLTGGNVGGQALQLAKDLGMEVGQVAKQWAGMASLGFKTEQQILADVQAFQQMEQAAGQTAQQVASIEQNTRKMRSGMQGMGIGFAGFLLGMTGMQMQRLGTSLLSPIGSYTKYAGQTSPYSAQYLAAQKSIEQSTVRIGQVMTSQIAPILERAAQVVEDIASYAEKHPEVAGTVAKVGAGAVAGGGALMALGQTVAGISALGLFLKNIPAANTAMQSIAKIGPNLAGLSTFGKIGIPAAGMAWGGLMNASAYAVGQGIRGAITTGAQYAPNIRLDAFYGNSAPQKIAELTKKVDDLGNTAQKTASKIGPGDAATKAFVSYQQANIEAEKQYEQERSELVKQYGQQRADLEREYEARRSDILKQIADLQSNSGEDVSDYRRQQAQAASDFHLSETRVEEDYYRQRAKLAEDYNIDVQRMEEDHQRKMRQMAQQHNLRMANLADERDALGMYREQQSYELDRRNAEEDYNVEASRRAQDFARRVKEMEQEFAISRARRMQDYQQRRQEEDSEFALRQSRQLQRLQEELKQLDEQHKVELEALAKQQAEKLKALDTQYIQEKNKRIAAFNDQLRDLGVALYNETTLKQQYWEYQAQALQRYIDQAKALTSNLPGYGQQQHYSGRAGGGYAGAGLYRLGEEGEEYVLTQATTRSMERMIGGRLTQQRVLALAMMGGGNQSVTYNDHRRFDSKLSASDRRVIQQDTRQIFEEVFGG